MVCKNLQGGVLLKEWGEVLQLWESSQAVFWLDVLRSSFPVDCEDGPETVALILPLLISCSWQVFLPAWFSSPPGARLNKESELSADTHKQKVFPPLLILWLFLYLYMRRTTKQGWGKSLRSRSCVEAGRWRQRRVSGCESGSQLFSPVSCFSPWGSSSRQTPAPILWPGEKSMLGYSLTQD